MDDKKKMLLERFMLEPPVEPPDDYYEIKCANCGDSGVDISAWGISNICPCKIPEGENSLHIEKEDK